MKKVLLLILVLLIGLVSVNAQEELTTNFPKQESIDFLRDNLGFFDRLKFLFQSQSTFSFEDDTYVCNDDINRDAPFAIGDFKTGLTERTIRCSDNEFANVDACSIFLYQSFPSFKFIEAIFVVEDEIAIFSRLNPDNEYYWLAYTCLSTTSPPQCQEGKSYCFGTGFYGVCENGVISDKGQCESKQCQIFSPSFGSSKSEVCKSITEVPTTTTTTTTLPPQCVEGKSYCFSSGAAFQPATYSVCENDIFLDKSACQSCLIEHPSFGDTKSAVCADVISSGTCKFEGKELKLGANLDWKCSTLDDTIRVRNVVSDISSSESCGFDLEKSKCGQEKFQQKTCKQGQCVLPGEDMEVGGILEEQLDDKTEDELEDSKCKRTSDCESGASCIPFDKLSSIVRERLAGGVFNVAENGICVFPKSNGKGGDGLGDIQLGAIGCSVADGLGITGENKCGLGWLIVGFIVFIIFAILARRN